MSRKATFLLLLPCLSWAVGPPLLRPSVAYEPSTAAREAARAVAESSLRAHTRFLASDLLRGRAPGSRGDRLAQLYIRSQLQAVGLEPGASDGKWLQAVPLLGVKTRAPQTISFRRGEDEVRATYLDEFMATCGDAKGRTAFTDAECVFVGYGIVAPEFEWDDFKGEDLEGKVLIILNDDPAGDPELFGGKRRLYYGRWDYKYQMAARKGAAGAWIIHTTPSASYPWQVVRTSWGGEQFELRERDGPRLPLEGWLTESAARRVVELGGEDLDALREAADRREFRPVSLGVQLSVELAAETREVETANVLGLLEGRDPARRGEIVIYTAHHDHLGEMPEEEGPGDAADGAAAHGPVADRIYNGALDNASGVAGLLALAKAFASLPEPPARSILFAAVGAEEQGLLGSAFLAANPPAPGGQLVAALNLDGLNVFGPTSDVTLIGMGKSSLDAAVERIASWQGRVVKPDPFPERGAFYRSDQFSFARVGVPGIYLGMGTQFHGRPDGWGELQIRSWIENHYHQPSDELREDWDWEGAAEDVRLLFHVGLHVAEAAERPAWNPGDEFGLLRRPADASAR